MGKKKKLASKSKGLHKLNKMVVRPKVFITESSNFKNLVQQLTGNGNSSPAPPPPPPFIDILQDQNSIEISLDSSCFSTPLESSPDCFSYLDPDLESLLMGVSNINYDQWCYGQQEALGLCDYDISTFM